MFERITFEKDKLAGQACIRGLRIPVYLIVSKVAYGESAEQILSDYPDLEPEDIQQALQYAAWLTKDRVYDE